MIALGPTLPSAYLSDLSSELSHTAVIPTRTGLHDVDIGDKYLVKHMVLLCKWFSLASGFAFRGRRNGFINTVQSAAELHMFQY